MYDYVGLTALVTGASSGIGEQFAKGLAARGAAVVLVARRADRLEQLAASIRADHGVRADVVAEDLTRPDATVRLLAALGERGVTVDVLVNNAGFATHAPLLDEDRQRVDDEVRLNVATVVELTHALLPGMVERRRGVVVNVASTAAFQPVPGMAVYGATKAFVLSFTEAVAYEVRDTGVRVLALCPGATQTEFFDVAGDAASVGRRQTAVQVVDTALRAIAARRSRSTVVSGAANRVGSSLPRFVPRRTATAITARLVGAS